ncbi:glycosyltransferase family 2 protein [Spirosoma aerophilum]
MISPPVFSIITVTYNAISTLEKTVQSVLRQDKTLFEYIIIDGGSSDGTVDCIEKYQDDLSYWISETDKGIYDAMNKGLDKAKGNWILFLGADDRLYPDIISKVSNHLDDSLDIIFGDVLFSNGERYNSEFNIKTILNNTVHHQGAFYNKRLFTDFRYDISIKAMADYELNLLIYLSGKKRKKIRFDIAECDIQGASSDVNLSLEELQLVHSKFYSPVSGFFLSKLIKLKYFLHYRFFDVSK